MAMSSAEDCLQYPWGLQTCFQVYGTKRKLQHNEPEMNSTEQSMAKRPCFIPSPLQTDDYPHSRLEMSIPHNPATSNPNICQKSTALPHEDMPASKHSRLSMPEEIPMDNDSEMCDESRNWQHSQQCSSGSPRYQESNEQAEILWCKKLHEETVAKRAVAEKLHSQLKFLQEIQFQSNDYWAMPQESQLKMTDELEQARIAMESDYVPDYQQYSCAPASAAVPMAGPNAHTTIGQVRCYCKPNWEGMLEPTSYI